MPLRGLVQTDHLFILFGGAVLLLDQIPGGVKTLTGKIFMRFLEIKIRFLYHCFLLWFDSLLGEYFP